MEITIDSEYILESIGPRFIIHRMYTLPSYEDGKVQDPSGESGFYKGMTLICYPGLQWSPGRTIDLPFGGTELGDSFIEIPDEVPEHIVLSGFNKLATLILNSRDMDNEEIKIELVFNTNNRLGHFRFPKFYAKSTNDVLRRLWIISNAYLDNLCFKTQYLLDIYQVGIEHSKIDYLSASIVYRPISNEPFKLNEIKGVTTIGDNRLAWLYRDGINSTSLPYKLLCFCRVIDAILMKRKKEKNISFHGDEIFKLDFEVGYSYRKRFESFDNKKFKKLYFKESKPKRNEVAHSFLDNSPDILNPFDLKYLEELSVYVTVSRYIAHNMIVRDNDLKIPNSNHNKKC